MATDFEHGGLKWVIDEIFESLKQARIHLESFVEDDEDSTQLQFCTSYLHQVAGTLNMLELGGAALLAEEMEVLSQAIYDGKTARREDGFEVLMRALIQLPDYLERLERGARDLPMVLLPLLNDLRASRGEQLLTEGAVFSADLSLDKISPEPDNGIDPGQLAKKIRRHFHLGLLGWYRDKNSLASINIIKKVVIKLKQSVKTANYFQLFSLMEAFIEGLMDKGIASSASTKLLLGQTDRYIKQLIDHGEPNASYTDNIEQELQSLKKNLLFYIAHCKSPRGRNGPAVEAIKSCYKLADIIPDANELDDALASMGGANAELMTAVTDVISADLATVKEQLDVFVRNLSESTGSSPAEGSEQMEGLQAMVTTMAQISDTLAMLGQNAPRNVLLEKIEWLKSVISGEQEPEQAALMEIASALLFVESSLTKMGSGGLFSGSDEDEEIDLSNMTMSDEERDVLLKATIDEAKTELVTVKESIVLLFDAFASGTKNPEENEQTINTIHDSLQSIAGVLEMLANKPGSQIVKDCAAYIANSLVSDLSLASQDNQQHLADTITAIEYYLDAVAEKQRDLSIIESVARSGIDHLLGREAEEPKLESELSDALTTWMSDVSAPGAGEELLNAVASVAEQVKLLQHDKAEEITQQMISMISLVGNNQDSLNDDIASTLRWATETINRIIRNATERRDSSLTESEKKNTEQPEITSKSSSYAEKDSVNGSEPDHKLTGGGEVFAGEEPLAEQEPSAEQEPIPISTVAQQTALAEDPAAGYPDIKKLETSEDIDPEIMEIFIEEAHEEFEKISTLFPQWKSSADKREILAEIRRSFHTLKGSGRLVGAYEMGEFAWAFEDLLNRVIENTIKTDEPLSALIESAIELLPEITNAFEQQRLSNADSSRLAAYAHILSNGEQFDINLLYADAQATETAEPSADREPSAGIKPLAEIESSAAIKPSADIEASVDKKPLSETEKPVPVMPDDEEGIDPVLLEIFTSEASGHIKNIEEYIEQCHLQDDVCSVDDSLIRSLHTLRGSAHMAEIHAIGNVSEQMEKTVKTIAEKGQKLDPELVQLLDEICHHCLQALEHLNAYTSLPEENVELEVRIAEKYEQVRHLENLLDDSAINELISISEARLLAEDSLEREEDSPELEENLEDEEQVTDQEQSFTQEPVPSASDTSLTTQDNTPEQPVAAHDEYDYELMEIFIDEGEEILQSSEQALRKLKENTSDTEVLNRFLRDMHTLKGGARMAGVNAIGDLAHSCESKLEKFTHDGVTFAANHVDLFLHVLDTLSAMLANLKNGQIIEKEPELIAQIESISKTEEPAIEQQTIELVDYNDSQEQEGRVDDTLITEESLTDEESSIEQESSTELESLTEQEPSAEEKPSTEKEIPVEEYDDELLEIFLEEAQELMDSSDSALSLLKNEPENKEQLKQLLRDLHTIKGGARMAGISPIGDLTHSIETQLEQITNLNQTPSQQFFELLHHAHDTLSDMLDNVKAGKPVLSADALIAQAEAIGRGESVELTTSDSDVVGNKKTKTPKSKKRKALSSVEENPEKVAPKADISKSDSQTKVDQDSLFAEGSLLAEGSLSQEQGRSDNKDITGLTVHGTEPHELAAENIQFVRTESKSTNSERVRVSSELLDELVNYAGEVSIYRSRLDQGSNEFQQTLDEMNTIIFRLREQLRRFEMETEAQIQSRKDQAESLGYERYEEFDPLEFDRFSNMQQITRAMAETVSDLDSIENTMSNINSESETLLIQQGRVNTDLQEGLMRTRMIPFKSQLPRFRRIVRQTAKELEKQVNFKLYGEDHKIDRRVLEKMMAPLEHLLRNAVAHGIETVAEREKAGKSRSGNIKLIIGRDGSEITIKVVDDGAGIDIDAVRHKAIEHELMIQESNLSDKDIMQFILKAGFSTALEVNQISGRGVGMDVVKNEIKQLNGTMEIESEAGKGTVFDIHMPLTMSVSRALMVEVGEEIFAIPLVGIENIIRESNDILQQLIASNDTYYQWQDELYQFMHLGTVLGLNKPSLPGEKNKAPILLARSGEHRVALFVDGLMGSREIVVKSVGPQLSTVTGVTGATILGDGKIALILDLGVLAREGAAMKSAVEQGIEVAASKDKISTVMVVDDSITVRKVTQRLLQRYNYKVITAKDGVDAIAVLHETIPDVMLLDVEMPRMDGFELATHMQDDEKFKDIPIIMITSRTGDKHRERAMKIGVNEYMGKPYQEHDLISNIKKLTDI